MIVLDRDLGTIDLSVALDTGLRRYDEAVLDTGLRRYDAYYSVILALARIHAVGHPWWLWFCTMIVLEQAFGTIHLSVALDTGSSPV